MAAHGDGCEHDGDDDMDQVFERDTIEFYDQKEWTKLCDLIDKRFKLHPDHNEPTELCEFSIDVIDILISKLTVTLIENPNEDLVKVARHLYKTLRNLLAFSKIVYIYVLHSLNILLNTWKIVESLRKTTDPECVSCMKMILQFLINLVVSNAVTTREVWKYFSTLMESLIASPSYSYYASALAYNVFRNDPILALESKIYDRVLDLYQGNCHNEYFTFLLEYFVKDKELNLTYVKYKPEQRILLLEVLQHVFEEDKQIMTSRLISTLSEDFKRKSDCILKTVGDYSRDIEPREVKSLLDVLASVSSEESYLKMLQTDKSLFINCVFLLKSIHSIGNMSDNDFTPVKRLSEISSDSGNSNHPAFGFKADLVRILGNLCWKNRSNQDEMRELDGIPLLLDCCNIDARNPFIMQWAIFAIRNVCDGNHKNQKLIASMNKEGVVNSADLLEMGMTLHSDCGNEIKIVPLNRQ